MSNTQDVSNVIVKQGVLPLYFNPDETVSVEILKATYRAGINAVEYTNRGETALSNFKKMVQVKNTLLTGMLLGVGTIKNMEQALAYIKAGADFLVSPGFVPDVAAYAVANDIFTHPVV